jgi:putative ABC transport system permease protein
MIVVDQAVGLYGVIAHSVSQRTREIGVRMALGAGSTNVRTMVIRQAMMPVLLGVVAGIAGAVALTRALASLLYGMNAVDPLTYSGVVAILVLVAAFASHFPARRASQVDPILALRYE